MNRLVIEWAKTYIDRTVTHGEAPREAIRKCSLCHYEANKMDEFLGDFRGKLEEFIIFIEHEWGWKITYDRGKGEILADENKEYCVCPMRTDEVFSGPELCYCSEGFAERMFSTVLMRPVRARVLRSILRDKKSCIYKIELSQ